MQINPATWEDLPQDRPAWRRSVKTGSAINEANRIAAAKAIRAARKSPAPRTNIIDVQALPTCPHCQRIFSALIGLVGHLRRQCNNNPTIPTSTSNPANPTSDSPTLIPDINSITPTIIETTSLFSSPVTLTIATTTAFVFTHTTTTTSTRNGDSLLNCPQCNRTFTSRIGLVAPAILTATATPTSTNDMPQASIDFSCPQCARNFNSRIGLVCHLRIHRMEAGEPVELQSHCFPSIMSGPTAPSLPVGDGASPSLAAVPSSMCVGVRVLVGEGTTQVALGHSFCLVQVANASVAASNWYPTLTCCFSKLGSAQPANATTGGLNRMRVSSVVWASTTVHDMQKSMYHFAADCTNFELTINAAKTVVMHQPTSRKEYNAPRINVNGAQLKNVETFAYLGSTLSRNTRIDDEVAQRMSKVSQAFGRLQASISVKIDAVIYEANRIAAANAKRAAHNSQAPLMNTANPQALPTLSMHILHAKWPGRTSSDAMQQQLQHIKFDINKHPFCHIRLKHHDDDHDNHHSSPCRCPAALKH
ncbi:unnamed protein product [Schistocephalus solidus]|uniref:C2H2-type domain-containing protein n=1 Tax=Schistocephalus solidus TaxID=70667 RepID=A0A3P7CB06_SCHSO|nr:unnamed protein product [Schistocephalus solidus]